MSALEKFFYIVERYFPESTQITTSRILAKQELAAIRSEIERLNGIIVEAQTSVILSNASFATALVENTELEAEIVRLKAENAELKDSLEDAGEIIMGEDA